jgi:DNA-binding response OmpR family regulator
MTIPHEVILQESDPAVRRILERFVEKLPQNLPMLIVQPSGPEPIMFTINMRRFKAQGHKIRLGGLLDEAIEQSQKKAEQPGKKIKLGPYMLERGGLDLEAQGATLRITEKERDLLLALYDAGTQGLEREALLEAVWGYGADIETHTLETHIYRIRQKIEKDPSKPLILITTTDGYALG